MEIKERLFHARNIEIWIAPHATNRDKQIAHYAACALTQLGKHVRLVFHPAQTPKNVCTVTLRGLASRVAQVSYEKDRADLKLHFTLQQGDLSPEHISFEVEPRVDLTIIVGDNSGQHNSRAAYNAILELLLNNEDPSLRLLGTVLFKFEFHKTHNLHAATITQDDLQAALLNPKHISRVVTFLRAQLGDQCSFLFFFEKSDLFQTIFWTAQSALQERVVRQPGCTLKGNWLLWDTPINQKSFLDRQLLAP